METNTLNITEEELNTISLQFSEKEYESEGEDYNYCDIGLIQQDACKYGFEEGYKKAIASLPTLLKEHGELKAAYKKLLFWIKDCDIVETIEDIDTEFGKELAELCNTGYELLSKSTSTQV